MVHLTGKLTSKKVDSLNEVGRYGDGGGLYLVVTLSGAKSWILRTVIKNKRTDIGLGGLAYTSLQDARKKAQELRAVARNGGDPRFSRQKVIPTFAELANTIYLERLPTWKNPKHASQWMNTLEAYAFPQIGDMSVDVIDSQDVLKVLSPIWTEKHETARRVMQRIGAVLDVAKAKKFRSGENPIQEIKALKVLAKVKPSEKHHGAMRWQDLPSFWEQLSAQNNMSALALQFTILTAARTSEALNMTWDEVDGATWTIPLERMKNGKEHQVPLCAIAMDILSKLKGISPSFVFEGQTRGKPLSNMAMENVLRRMAMKKHGITVHGFRSTFRDWSSEVAKAPREVAEACLAHTIGNKVEQAYARSSLYERRAPLMERWGQFVTADEAKVVRLG